ncbi:MAG: PQQ-dependent sugar dehydrogenase, partial [Phaeodactylibacter sp.]|nr:PQQ-dependent sugar dehydrogenase [Phaeodactylibacter sp.]
MKLRLLLFLSILAVQSFAQVDNPVPEAIPASGILFELQEYVTIPISSGQEPKARINLLREVPDGSGRQFVNDLRGKFWVIDNGEVSIYLNPVVEFPDFIQEPGKGTGFGAFAFHPEFATNGKFYTSHAEAAASAPADFSPMEDNGIALQWVVHEWTTSDINAVPFEGTRRELLRLDFPYVLHGIQDIQFNPTATPDDEDYGLLYICVGDGGSSLNFLSANIQTAASYLGTILRIDPLGNNSINGQYGIPATNPFAGDLGSMGEVWTYGFRNPHRICWDTEGDHKMLIGDIGEKNLEEVNLGLPGLNYGWENREGTFLYDRELGQSLVFELPVDDAMYDYTYPVAQFDHDEGLAIVGGLVYRGSAFPELYGKYIFGDIPSGRVFMVNADELELGSLADIEELNFVDADENPTNLLQLIGTNRADLRFG